ncbi:hypothetical protein UFOVP330_35 [uncultured Caudovirales phage]|uniref:Uncharacterized protein n=1 Tax=uncultured Caudovirales phage TaxID=2100421 RepID=A0A6J5LYZ7_9CAUD|nr:hypothetical protein UFOVP330_35 [uncultured Caudovirales phage]
MGKSKPQTVTQTTSVPEESKPFLYGEKGILPRARALSEQPLNLPDYRVAGLSQPQRQAFAVAQSGIGGYMPALTQGAQATQGGIGAISRGMGIIPGALSAAMPYQRGSAAMGYGSTQGYNPSMAYRDYMNPYIEDVIQQTERDISRQGKIQEQQLRSQAVGQGAFGGSRSALAERELGRNIAEQQARTASNLRASGYEQAQQQAQQAFEQQQQRQAEYARLLGSLGTEYGQLGIQGAGQIGNLAQGLGGLGAQMASLGELGQQLNIRDVGTLMDIGNVQQQQQQAVLDAQRQNAYQRTMAPYQQLGFYSDIYQGLPVGQTQTTTQPGPSTISQIGGLAYGLASLGRR